VQAARASIAPAPGNGDGVVAEDGLLIHAALAQAHTFTVFEVYSWDQEHGMRCEAGRVKFEWLGQMARRGTARACLTSHFELQTL
jgi:hypothetical protein